MCSCFRNHPPNVTLIVTSALTTRSINYEPWAGTCWSNRFVEEGDRHIAEFEFLASLFDSFSALHLFSCPQEPLLANLLEFTNLIDIFIIRHVDHLALINSVNQLKQHLITDNQNLNHRAKCQERRHRAVRQTFDSHVVCILEQLSCIWFLCHTFWFSISYVSTSYSFYS